MLFDEREKCLLVDKMERRLWLVGIVDGETAERGLSFNEANSLLVEGETLLVEALPLEGVFK